MEKFKKFDRVRHDHLGDGTFIKYIEGFLSLVQWDKKPSIRYNMGENPTCVITDELVKINDK